MYIGHMHQPEFMEQTDTQPISDSDKPTAIVGNLDTGDDVSGLDHTQNQSEQSVPSTERRSQDNDDLDGRSEDSAMDNTEDDTSQTNQEND